MRKGTLIHAFARTRREPSFDQLRVDWTQPTGSGTQPIHHLHTIGQSATKRARCGSRSAWHSSFWCSRPFSRKPGGFGGNRNSTTLERRICRAAAKKPPKLTAAGWHPAANGLSGAPSTSIRSAAPSSSPPSSRTAPGGAGGSAAINDNDLERTIPTCGRTRPFGCVDHEESRRLGTTWRERHSEFLFLREHAPLDSWRPTRD